jgi:hypothetical protein
VCHAVSVTGSCPGGIIGDGEWDRDAFFRVNYGWNNSTWKASTGLSANATRYEVYQWELNNPTVADMQQNVSANRNGYSYPVCRPPGITPGGTTPDRRVMTVAVINCKAEGVQGRKSGVEVHEWMDVFLVEPAFPRSTNSDTRTTNGDIYVEVIGRAIVGGGGGGAGGAQTIVKSKPYLIE